MPDVDLDAPANSFDLPFSCRSPFSWISNLSFTLF